MSAKSDARRRRKRAAQGDGVAVETTCKCGHPRAKHVFDRARCTVEVENEDTGNMIPCGCVQFEFPADKSLFTTALDLDEQLELANKELDHLRDALRGFLSDDEETQNELLARTLRNNEKLRSGIRAIVNGPTTSRAEVQAALLKLMDIS